MDIYSYNLANLLVGNDNHSATIEMNLIGPELEFATEAVIAICGSDMQAIGDDLPFPMWRPVYVPAGFRLKFGAAIHGRTAYLAISGGGIQVGPVLGSRSTSIPSSLSGLAGRVLLAGDLLPLSTQTKRWEGMIAQWGHDHVRKSPSWSTPSWFLHPSWGKHIQSSNQPRVIEVMKGNEWEQFAEQRREQFISGEISYVVHPNSNRMGFRLSGDPILKSLSVPMKSQAVTYGTIQVPPDGQPMILMADRQTTGGYPRLAQVVMADLPHLAQARNGENIVFSLTDLTQAIGRWANWKQAFRLLEKRLILNQLIPRRNNG
jgi:antagonist of KipI